MSKTVSLTVDGKEIKVLEGTNLIDAAETAGIHIPNLCYIKGMKGIGACRLCLVEIEGMKAPMIACTTKAKDGMVVHTKTEKVEEVRRFVIDLILSMHPLDCMTCTKAGACNLQKYAYDFEIKESNFTRKKFGYPIDEACILCARCVRVCKEQGTNVLDFMGRGVGAKVVTAMDKPLQESGCTFCGSCVDACPVNALLEADRWRKGREWEYEKVRSVCLLCGNGCDIIASKKDESIVKINAGAPDGSVERYICAIGRFGFDANSSDVRLTTPLKREDGELKETTWKDALKIVAEKLKKSGKNTGIISSGSILNQDAFVLAKFASDVVKTKNVDTTVSTYADAESMKFSDSVEFDRADIIVIAGIDLSQWTRVLPALDASIRKRVSRGAKLIVINEEDTSLMQIATLSFKGDEAKLLAQIAKSLIGGGKKAGKDMESALSDVVTSEETDRAAELIAGAEYPVIFCHPSLFKASKNLSLLVDVKVVAVPFEANARGVVALGLTTEGKTYSEIIQGGVDLLYVVGDISLEKRPDVGFMIVQSSYMSDLVKEADIVLPSSTFLESNGTVINYLGKLKELDSIIQPQGDARQHREIIIDVSKIMGKPIKESAKSIKSAFEVSSKQKFSLFKKSMEIDIKPSDFIDKMNQQIKSHSRLVWLKETEKAVMSNT
jgi:NADH dehydrogenase/NADH:ubiquinone oxidoreductase subunit G